MSTITKENLNDPKAPHNVAMNKAKIKLMSTKDSAFFMTLVFSLKHQWSLDIPTAQTDGTYVRYNPNFWMSLNMEEQVFLMLHEAMHVAYMHMLRIGKREPRKWNHACDYVINDHLINRGFKMPQSGLYNKQFHGMSADEVYNLIPNPPSSGGGGFGDMGDLVDPGSGDGQGKDQNQQGQGKTREQIEHDIQDILIRAATQSKMAGDSPGTIPGAVEIFLNKLLDPKLPWHRILAKYLNKYAKNDYSWKTPNRRYFPAHYLPGMWSQSLMDLTFAVDTSGSVSDEDFLRFISEVRGVIKMMKPDKLTLIQFDTEIKAVDHIKNLADLSRVKFTGRGGTDVTDVFKYVNEKKPQVLMIFTDGEFYKPPVDCNTDLVWLIHGNPSFNFPQGKIIHYEI